MKTVTVVTNTEELLAYARRTHPSGHELLFVKPEDVTFVKQGMDHRNGWGESFLVTAGGFVIGFTNADLTRPVDPTRRTLMSVMANQVQAQHGVKVLFARIMGSHLWGYADGVSDYDYQFVYVRPLNDYLGFLPTKQIRFETTFLASGQAGHVDVTGHDITNFLRLMSHNDVTASQFMYAPRDNEDASCMAELASLFRRTRTPNLLTRKYIGHARAAAQKYRNDPDNRAEAWGAVRSLVFAYQMREAGDLHEMDVFKASERFTPELDLKMGPNRMPVYSKEMFERLGLDADQWVLQYPERPEEEVEEFNTASKAIVRRFADTNWS